MGRKETIERILKLQQDYEVLQRAFVTVSRAAANIGKLDKDIEGAYSLFGGVMREIEEEMLSLTEKY